MDYNRKSTKGAEDNDRTREDRKRLKRSENASKRKLCEKGLKASWRKVGGLFCAVSGGEEVRRVRRVYHATLNPTALLTKN